MILNSILLQFGGGITRQEGSYDFDPATTDSVLNTTESFISNMIGLLTLVAGLSFVVYFLLGAFKWISAGGDSGAIQKARDQMVQGVIGMVVVIMAYSIIAIIGGVLGYDFLAVSSTIFNLRPPGT